MERQKLERERLERERLERERVRIEQVLSSPERAYICHTLHKGKGDVKLVLSFLGTT